MVRSEEVCSDSCMATPSCRKQQVTTSESMRGQPAQKGAQTQQIPGKIQVDSQWRLSATGTVAVSIVFRLLGFSVHFLEYFPLLNAQFKKI